MKDIYCFGTHPGPREKTFILHGKIEDHANDVHDYLKYLKFGYGRATDDASMEIRHGRMTREDGIALVDKYDSVKPSTLNTYLKFLNITEDQFNDWIEPMRDDEIWEKDSNGQWKAKDSVTKHINDAGIEDVSPDLLNVEDLTFGENNKGFYWKEEIQKKEEIGKDVRGFHIDDKRFIIL